MNDTTEVTQQMQFNVPVKAVLSMLPCLFFLYVNAVMLFALLSKPLLLETPRYILFGHLLLSESLQLLMTMLLYIFAVTMVRMMSYICIILTIFATFTFKISPLNLAVMSLERYVAICFPLRHADIVTTRTTGVAIAGMWTVASIDYFTQLFLFVSVKNTNYTVPRFCHRHLYRQPLYTTINNAFIIVVFVFVIMVIIYTFFAIMITVRSASASSSSSTESKGSKAYKTVLLHLLQVFLCLTSTVFNTINSDSLWGGNFALATNVQYALFLCLIIFPKFLSPLIYGLRDQTFRHVFKYHFTFGFKITAKTFPTV
ncbi:olfactory receptor 2T1-like [Notothenia coriiceps]|uniref:Olfactory receptor 2T1-like n=1 Tax=Notothenia coriiceps TaxID=8208 RepID=A0A6I9N1U1_9TELE|nr:PREDICTED: olfactory receptor 2T1-like [Notothenia coriiceps]